MAGDLAPWPTLTAPVSIVEDREGTSMNVLASAPPSEHGSSNPFLQETEAGHLQGHIAYGGVSPGHALWFFASKLSAHFFHSVTRPW